MQQSNLKYLSSKLVTLVGSRKFWASAVAIGAALGLDIDPTIQGVIVAAVAVVYQVLTAAEDIANRGKP